MLAMPEPFESSKAPRLITPEELAMVVKLCRQLRSWSQEALASVAGITVRTLQRVEAGHPSDLQTRRALARAFRASDIDAFNKPSEFLSVEQIAEKWKKEEEERKQNFKEIPATVTDGKALVEMAARAGAFSFGRASEFKLPPAIERIAAELEDYIRDAVDIADEVGAVGRLDMSEDLDRLLKQLATAGVSIIVAEEDVDIRMGGGQPLKLKVGHVAICQKGQEPKTVWAAKDIQARV